MGLYPEALSSAEAQHTAVTLRNPEPRDVADRLALGFDPAIVHMFGVDPNASDTVPALLPPTEATVEQWLDAIAKHPHSWIMSRGRASGARSRPMSRLDTRRNP
jgi:hypothetical protein